MMAAGVPVIPGTTEPIYDVRNGKKEARRIGYPVMIKAALGGGGKGMRAAFTEEEFDNAFQTAQTEAKKAFGDDTMYIEHFVEHPRHIEFQILADSKGNVIHLGERDCSIQRNHQKVIEEAPCRAISDKLRKKMGEAAVKAAKAAHYVNAGTIEFLLEKNEQFYFMEMNTRIQVEHPVTEWVTGLDLIKEQIRHCLRGSPVCVPEGYQDPPATPSSAGSTRRTRTKTSGPPRDGSKVCICREAAGCGWITAVYSGYTIPPYYDSMIAKLIVHGKDPEGGHCQDDQRPGGSDRGRHRHQRGLSLPDPERAGLSGGTDGY